VDAGYRVEIGALRELIAADRAAGHRPICVIGNAGTVNTGATDDLRGLAALCREERLWFHVDGAFGAFAALAPSLRAAVAGMEEADSLAVDLHKWGYLPFEVGLALVRHPEAHRATFAAASSYLDATPRGIVAGGLPFADLGVQLTRGFRALKVWMSLKAHGADLWGRLVEQNVAQARHLRDRVLAEPRLELLAPVPLNVVCFRYTAPGLDGVALDAVNREILVRVQERGLAVPSSTVLGGRFALRVAVTNHRSRREDFDLFADAVLAAGAELTSD
jgi:glutamate/tyrosine decarboxylase-like PLP-dependent enzyme